MGNEKEIRLPWPGWTIGKYLGAGGYGKVYEIERMLSGVRERAALKVVSRPADDAEIEACYEIGYDQASMKASYEEEIQRYVKNTSDEGPAGPDEHCQLRRFCSRTAQGWDRRADIYPDGAAHTAAEGDEAEHAQ